MIFSDHDIRLLLRAKHSGDVMVEECKNGPTWFSRGLRKLDVWVMKRTYRPLTMIGYEIKASRSDFLQDEKWMDYLDCCHQFYFVCPPKMISVDELPESVGLMWCSSTRTRLYTKRKAPHREIEPPIDLLIYILMSRSVVGDPDVHKNNREYWRDWLERQDKDEDLGRRVAYRIAEIVSRAKTDKYLAEKRLAKWQGFKNKLEAHGINPDGEEWHFEDQMKKLTGMIPDRLINRLAYVADDLTKLASQLKEAKGNG